MFDDLRQQLIQNDSEPEPKEPKKKNRRAPRSSRPAKRNILGLTSGQGFFLALMVFLNVCVLGAFALVVLGRVQVPGL